MKLFVHYFVVADTKECKCCRFEFCQCIKTAFDSSEMTYCHKYNMIQTSCIFPVPYTLFWDSILFLRLDNIKLYHLFKLFYGK